MYNKHTLIGRLGEDPVVRFTQNQKQVVTLSVATAESWKDKQGQRQERTEWHRVVLFGKLAEIAGEHLKKGSLALFEGPVRTRKWQANDGTDRYTTETFANAMKMLPSGSGKPSDPGAQPAPSTTSAAPAGNNPPNLDDYDDFDDDIPF